MTILIHSSESNKTLEKAVEDYNESTDEKSRIIIVSGPETSSYLAQAMIVAAKQETIAFLDSGKESNKFQHNDRPYLRKKKGRLF